MPDRKFGHVVDHGSFVVKGDSYLAWKLFSLWARTQLPAPWGGLEACGEPGLRVANSVLCGAAVGKLVERLVRALAAGPGRCGPAVCHCCLSRANCFAKRRAASSAARSPAPPPRPRAAPPPPRAAAPPRPAPPPPCGPSSSPARPPAR